ncbi:MAG: calcium/sodium antiporter [Deltaproteobacteria bacterium]|nr:calcium/sodium antiporter [Deltaproteobacteria bacterium]
MFLGTILVLAGLLLLYYGAESLVNGSSRLALSFGVRPLVVVLTVVAFATSMPELMVSLFAVTRGASSMAAGNIIGSNIANIGLILGVAALITPIIVARSTLVREIPIMVAASLGLYLVAMDGEIAFMNGLGLFFCLLVFLAYCLVTARKPSLPVDGEVEKAIVDASSGRGRNIVLVLVGMAGLGFGAELMVRGAVMIATLLGISELIIGLSIVAIGTSLPELAASVMSAWKGEMDISVGNVIGSNIFNVLFVLGICPMIQPITIEPRVLSLDFPIMLAFCALLVGLLTMMPPRLQLDRKRGVLLLGAYLLFIVSLFF